MFGVNLCILVFICFLRIVILIIKYLFKLELKIFKNFKCFNRGVWGFKFLDKILWLNFN